MCIISSIRIVYTSKFIVFAPREKMLWIYYTLRSINFTDYSFFSGSTLLCLSPTLSYLFFLSACISWLCGNLNDCISGGGAVPVSSLSLGLLCVLCLQHSVLTYKTVYGVLRGLAGIPESVNLGAEANKVKSNTSIYLHHSSVQTDIPKEVIFYCIFKILSGSCGQ